MVDFAKDNGYVFKIEWKLHFLNVLVFLAMTRCSSLLCC